MLAALSTRMFRFPAPGRTDPKVEGLLAFDRGKLTGGWAMEKVVSTLAVAPVLGVLCLVSWRRLSLWGLLVIYAMAVGKMGWGVVDGAGTGWAMLGPALAVLAVCDAVVLCFTRRARRGGHAEAGRHGARRGSIRRDAPRTALLQGPRACLSLVTLNLFTERSGVPVKPPQLVGPGGSYDTYA